VRVPLPEPEPHLILGLTLTAASAHLPGLDPAPDLRPGPGRAGVDPAAVPAVATLPAGDSLADGGYSEAVPALTDRVSALGETLSITSPTGEGTTLLGSLPVSGPEFPLVGTEDGHWPRRHPDTAEPMVVAAAHPTKVVYR
jgi:hypothetical protein